MGQFLPHIREIFKLIEANKEQVEAKIGQERWPKKEKNNPKVKSCLVREVPKQ